MSVNTESTGNSPIKYQYDRQVASAMHVGLKSKQVCKLTKASIVHPFHQGILIEGKGSVHLNSSLRKVVL
jgi:hypothetical protein